MIFPNNGTIPEGSVVNFLCNEGYKMVGPSNKTCKEKEGWVPDVEVLCTKN